MNKQQLTDFGNKYAEAWCSRNAASVASFFSPSGSLKVNNDPPAAGRDAIRNVAQGFMDSFPDMKVTMDKLANASNGIEFHWTLTGTYSENKNNVKISGMELWQIGDDGLIRESLGSFDADDYNRQIGKS